MSDPRVNEDPILLAVRIKDFLERKPYWTVAEFIGWHAMLSRISSDKRVSHITDWIQSDYKILLPSPKPIKGKFKRSQKEELKQQEKNALHGLFIQSNYFTAQELPFSRHMLYNLLDKYYPPIGSLPPLYNHSRIRVGFLSDCLNRHAIGFFVGHLLKSLCSIFDIYVYYTNPDHDLESARFKQFPLTWRDCAEEKDEILARTIRKDEIDVLIDLEALGFRAKTNMLRYRPARKIVNFCGYPSSGGSLYTHRLVDCNSDPPTAKQYMKEKLVFLDPCFLSFQWFPSIVLPEIKYEKVDNKIRIGVLNKCEKILSKEFLEMLEAMSRNNEDVKFCLRIEKEKDYPLFREKLDRKTEFWMAMQWTNFLDSMNRLDLCIDSYPYSGTTTTCSLLTMGLPSFTVYNQENPHLSNVTTSIQLNIDPEMKSHCAPSVKKMIRIHQLIAKAFIVNDDPEHKTQINHKNRKKDDNRVENLEWCTPAYNSGRDQTSFHHHTKPRKDKKSGLPIGVYESPSGKFYAQCYDSQLGKTICRPYRETVEEAEADYQQLRAEIEAQRETRLKSLGH